MKSLLLVVGLDRSCTSLISGCLSRSGVDFGRHESKPPPDHPGGVFELESLNRLNDRVFSLFGLPRNSPRPLPGGWMDHPDIPNAVSDLVRIVEEEFADTEGVAGVSDPRICRLLPLWQAAEKKLEVPFHYVHVLGNPLDEFRSLQKRGGFTQEEASGLWMTYLSDAVHFLPLNPTQTRWVFADSFQSDPVEVCRDLLSWIGIEADPLDAEQERNLDVIQKLEAELKETSARLEEEVALHHWDRKEAHCRLKAVLENQRNEQRTSLHHQWRMREAPFYRRSQYVSWILFPKFLRRALFGFSEVEWERVVDEQLFDEEFYLVHNPDILHAGLDPWFHYVRKGWKEGRDPSGCFSTSFYLQENPDVREAGICPLLHYARIGAREGRKKRQYASYELSNESSLPEEQVLRRNLPLLMFLSGEPETPGHAYRIDSLVECVPRHLYQVQSAGPADLSILCREGPVPDILWIWRYADQPELSRLIEMVQSKGGCVHYDVDDLMVAPELVRKNLIDGIRSMELEASEIEKLYTRHRITLLRSDHASAPTEPLAMRLRRCQPNVYTLHNAFTIHTLMQARKARRKKPEDGLFRMGYACGSRTHQRDFARMLPAILEILEGYPDARLVTYPQALLLEEYPDLLRFESQIEKRDMVPVSELIVEYARYDINLAPIETENIFCECKSQLKFFEAALVHTPTLANPTQPFREGIRHGETGFLSDEPEEWVGILRRCIEEPAYRRKVGRAAYDAVLWRYSQDRQRWLLLRILGIVKGKSGPEVSGMQAYHLSLPEKEEAYAPPTPGETECIFQTDNHCESRVTVIVPLYNYARFVEEALDSLVNQSLTELDLVVVDDHSTDDSVEVARIWMEKHQGRFGQTRLLKHLRNRKLGTSRNTAVQAAETPYYFPLDPDNRLHPDCLRICLEQLEERGLSFVYPQLEVFGDTRTLPETRPWSPVTLMRGNYIDAMALVRKSTWTALGGYHTDPEMLGWEDFDFWCKAVELGFWGEVALQGVAYYRAHDESMLEQITDRFGFKQGLIRAMSTDHPWLRLEPATPS